MSAIKRGGVRAGAGRPTTDGTRIHLKLPPWAVTLARALGNGNVSRGVLVALEKLRME